MVYCFGNEDRISGYRKVCNDSLHNLHAILAPFAEVSPFFNHGRFYASRIAAFSLKTYTSVKK